MSVFAPLFQALGRYATQPPMTRHFLSSSKVPGKDRAILQSDESIYYAPRQAIRYASSLQNVQRPSRSRSPAAQSGILIRPVENTKSNQNGHGNPNVTIIHHGSPNYILLYSVQSLMSTFPYGSSMLELGEYWGQFLAKPITTVSFCALRELAGTMLSRPCYEGDITFSDPITSTPKVYFDDIPSSGPVFEVTLRLTVMLAQASPNPRLRNITGDGHQTANRPIHDTQAFRPSTLSHKVPNHTIDPRETNRGGLTELCKRLHRDPRRDRATHRRKDKAGEV
ncbi:hypothetical protein CIB48_g2964 [Xylaria polymorpha]|nr:hypothetical protein CIB48_g2964 [Xylaria polymorpha]